MADLEGIKKIEEAVVVSTHPDVCLTPVGGTDYPIPYYIVGHFEGSEGTAGSVRFERCEAFHMNSFVPTVTGNEAGTSGGVVSGVNQGVCHPITHSPTVRSEGHYVVRHDSLFHMNAAANEADGNTLGKAIYTMMCGPAGPTYAALAEEQRKANIGPAGDVPDAEYKKAAKMLGVTEQEMKDWADLFAEAETDGQSLLDSGNPKLLFETHYFDRYVGDAVRKANKGTKAFEWLTRSYDDRGGKYGTYASNWKMFEDAQALDASAAMKSVSVTRYQIMGSAYKRVGYKSAGDFYNAIKGGDPTTEMHAFAKFLKGDPTLVKALKKQDWETAARQYNGSGYKKNKYDTKLKTIWAKMTYGKRTGVKITKYLSPYGVMKMGNKGPHIRALQKDLKKLGYKTETSGIFDKATKDAVEAFQKDAGFKKKGIDGIVGSGTLSALDRSARALSEAAKAGKP